MADGVFVLQKCVSTTSKPRQTTEQKHNTLSSLIYLIVILAELPTSQTLLCRESFGYYQMKFLYVHTIPSKILSAILISTVFRIGLFRKQIVVSYKKCLWLNPSCLSHPPPFSLCSGHGRAEGFPPSSGGAPSLSRLPPLPFPVSPCVPPTATQCSSLCRGRHREPAGCQW